MYLLEEKSVVEWCEAHTDRYAISPYISEMTNTLSNLSFLYVAYLLTQQGTVAPACAENVASKKLNTLFWQCNATLVCVGLGSAIFHATETFVGEIADELPMSILMYYYVSIACHIRKWRFPRAIYLGVATLGWSLYLMYRQHVIFLTLFLCQLAIPIYITVAGGLPSPLQPPCSCVKCVVLNGRETTVPLRPSLSGAGGSCACAFGASKREASKQRRQPPCLCLAFASIAFGKACWLFERYLHTYKICPEMSSPLYLLHSFWHLGAAFGHYWIMRCWEQHSVI